MSVSTLPEHAIGIECVWRGIDSTPNNPIIHKKLLLGFHQKRPIFHLIVTPRQLPIMTHSHGSGGDLELHVAPCIDAVEHCDIGTGLKEASHNRN